MNKPISLRASIGLLLLICLSTLLYSAFSPLSAGALTRPLQQGPLQLQVEPLKQQETTSCGEAAITMVYNYLYPDAAIKESDVIRYAIDNEYYLPHKAPFTSPANMVKVAKHYAEDIGSGNIFAQQQGLNLLLQKLQANEPVIVDVTTRLYDPDAGAHFVVVTGVSLDPSNKEIVLIHYNDPLTGQSKSARWDGEDGFWNAWQNNPDPGGSGWWMTIEAPPN
ncbi:MAG: papain-like cysteine protease family protein [Anaerolineales bacterium]